MHILYAEVERKTKKVFFQKIPERSIINKQFTFLTSNFALIERYFSFNFHNTINYIHYQVKYE